tara:strand:+ start:24 stop:371 length:348 start_codon:yes stop_codon:yes gene_type:complete
VINKINANIYIFSALLMLCGCAVNSVSAQNYSDSALEERVEAILQSASDLPENAITVEVEDGVVTLMGSIVCDTCGGVRTPPGVRTTQQSLGAVVRAVPGVVRVVFDLSFESEGA